MEIVKFTAFVLVTLLVSNVLGKIANICNAKIDEIQQNTKLIEYDNLNLLIDQAQTIVTAVVQSVNQTYVYLCFFSLLLSKCSVPQSSVLNFPLSLSLNNLICIVASLPKWLSNLYSVCFQFSTGHCQLGVMLDLNLCFFLSNLFLFLCLLFKWQWHRLNSHPGSKSWNDL